MSSEISQNLNQTINYERNQMIELGFAGIVNQIVRSYNTMMAQGRRSGIRRRRRTDVFGNRNPLNIERPIIINQRQLSNIQHLPTENNLNQENIKKPNILVLENQNSRITNKNCLKFEKKNENVEKNENLKQKGCSKQFFEYVRNCGKIFEGKSFAVSNCSEYIKHDVLLACQKLGGKIIPRYNEETCTHLITPIEFGEDFEKAKKQKEKIFKSETNSKSLKIPQIVSLHWLEDCILAKQYFDPFKPVLHFPLKNSKGIPEMKNCVISVTGFFGKERSDLKLLINSIGAIYSGSLTKNISTHLICHSPNGEKFKKALEWGIKIVDKSWLLNCAKQWQKVPEKVPQIDVER